jgi:A/G-specific adenine glycosylase
MVINDGLNPESRNAPGVGQYISRAIAVGVRNEPLAMVDSNWVRIVHRIFGGRWLSDYRFDSRLQSIALSIVEADGNARHANWAILDLGAALCRPTRPLCPECPIRSACEYGANVPGTEA